MHTIHRENAIPLGTKVHVVEGYRGYRDQFIGGGWYVVRIFVSKWGHVEDYGLARHPAESLDVVVTPSRVRKEEA